MKNATKKSQLTSTTFWVVIMVLVLAVVVLLFSDWGQRLFDIGEQAPQQLEGLKDYDGDNIINREDMCCPAVCKTDPDLVEKDGPRKGCAPNQQLTPCDSTALKC